MESTLTKAVNYELTGNSGGKMQAVLNRVDMQDRMITEQLTMMHQQLLNHQDQVHQQTAIQQDILSHFQVQHEIYRQFVQFQEWMEKQQQAVNDRLDMCMAQNKIIADQHQQDMSLIIDLLNQNITIDQADEAKLKIENWMTEVQVAQIILPFIRDFSATFKTPADD